MFLGRLLPFLRALCLMLLPISVDQASLQLSQLLSKILGVLLFSCFLPHMCVGYIWMWENSLPGGVT